MKHTQGTWTRGSRYGNTCIIKSGDQYICEVYNADKDASVIAAAPELLEALEQCLTRISAQSKDTWDLKAIYTARAAIKKATI